MGISRKYMQPYEQSQPSRGMKLIGLRFYPNHIGGEGERLTMHIQKSLYGHTEWFFFNKGFEIIEDGNSEITAIRVRESAFDSSFMLYSIDPQNSLIISVSAIIGQNGTGKSTIVDNVIRLLNNLSAAIIGEDYVYSSAQHLHYIDGVYASLAIYQDSHIKILTCKGRILTVTTFEADISVLDRQYESSDNDVVELYTREETFTILDGTISESEPLPPQDNFKESILQDWFYTLVSNYSLYAYNYRDYLYERSSECKLSRLNSGQVPDSEEDFYWLKGLFHKNDGYQTPVVIHPMRDNGYVNAAKVNQIGKQNLISLCFQKGHIIQEDGSIDYFPFRIINKTHQIVAFTFFEGRRAYRDFVGWLKIMCIEENSELWKKLFILEQPIKKFWSEVIGISCDMNGSLYSRATWDYLTYKTIKVLRTYIQYQTIWHKIEDETFIDTINSDLLELLRDSSHRTQKIRRAVCFLRFCCEDDYYMNYGPSVNLDEIYEWMLTKVGKYLFPNRDYPLITTEDLLPTPVIDVRLELVDKEHIEAYKKRTYQNFIPFEGLSSGERQVAYTLGNIIYHLKNIESGYYDINASKNHQSSFKYHFVNIILDEVELYFHPDLQRRFVNLLVDSIAWLKPSTISGVNITMVTHSPFVLSDIPDDNILFLSRNYGEKISGKTFAANIHDLFNNTFILPFSIGALAQKEINSILSYYNQIRNDASGWSVVLNPSRMEERQFEKMKYIAQIIGDEYLSGEIKDMVEEIEVWRKKTRKCDEED